MTRTAVGRRALQVVLLAGGLFALGLLFGEQAHAADRMAPTTPVPVVQSVTGSVTGAVTGSVTGSLTRPVTGSVKQSLEQPVAHVVKSAGSSVLGVGSVPSSTVTDVTNVTHITDSVQSPVIDTVQTPVTDTVDTVQAQVTETVRHVVQPVGELVVQPVVDDVVLPIGDLVGTVTGGLTGTPAEILPSLPELPSLPGLPTLPGVGGQVPPAAGAAPQPSAGGGVVGGADEGVAGQQRTVAGATSAYGPARIATQAEGADTHRGHQGVRPVQVPAPAHQGPPDNPTGALGNQSAVDNGGPRHGDAHAVTPHHRVPLRLVPGASAVVTAAETRDRFRDIPVFPG